MAIKESGLGFPVLCESDHQVFSPGSSHQKEQAERKTKKIPERKARYILKDAK